MQPIHVTQITSRFDDQTFLIRWGSTSVHKAFVDALPESGDIPVYEALNLINEAVEAPNRIRDNAAAIGTEVHEAIRLYLINGEKPILSCQDARNCFNSFLNWADNYRPEADETDLERELVTVDGCVVGHADFTGTIMVAGERKRYVLDWKSSSGLYDSHRVQTAAYRSMFPEAQGNGCVLLRKNDGLYLFADYSKRYRKDRARWALMVQLFFMSHPLLAKKAGYGG